MTPPVFRFTCGHVGRTNDAPYAKAQAFIRVAEIRKAKVIEPDKVCPDCKGSGPGK